MVCAIKFEECVVGDSIRPWGGFFVGFCECASDVTRSEWSGVKLLEVTVLWGCWEAWKPMQLCEVDLLAMAVSRCVKGVGSLFVIRGLNVRLSKSVCHYLFAIPISVSVKLFLMKCLRLQFLLLFLDLFQLTDRLQTLVKLLSLFLRSLWPKGFSSENLLLFFQLCDRLIFVCDLWAVCAGRQ